MAAPLTKEQKTTATIAKARVTNMTDFFFHRYRQAPADWARGNPYSNSVGLPETVLSARNRLPKKTWPAW
jgi:hypothetical protein